MNSNYIPMKGKPMSGIIPSNLIIYLEGDTPLSTDKLFGASHILERSSEDSSTYAIKKDRSGIFGPIETSLNRLQIIKRVSENQDRIQFSEIQELFTHEEWNEIADKTPHLLV